MQILVALIDIHIIKNNKKKQKQKFNGYHYHFLITKILEIVIYILYSKFVIKVKKAYRFSLVAEGLLACKRLWFLFLPKNKQNRVILLTMSVYKLQLGMTGYQTRKLGFQWIRI